MHAEGWKTKKLRDILSSVDAGVSVNGEDRAATSDEYGVLKISAVTEGIFRPHENKAIRSDELARAAINPSKDCILISRSNTEALVGASAYVSQDHKNLFLPDKLWQLRPSCDEQTDMRWLSYWLASDSTRSALSKLATGTSGSMKNISKSQLLALDIQVPPIREQRRIAHILSTWDQAIATTERLLANGRMQWNALIGLTLHLPSANPDASAPAENSGLPASVQPGIPTLPPAPAGWRRVQLRDHLKEVRRPVALVNDETYTLVTVKRSRGGVELREVLQGNEVKTPTQFYVHADDFLISKRQIVHGACGIVPPALDGAVVSNEYAALNTDGEIDLRFLRYLSESRYFQQTCFHSSIGVHVEKMIFKTDHWLNWPFNIPPLAQQKHIVEILDTASREIVSISEQLKALKREKSALMAQLLTGKRRVRLPADEAEPA
ncbi:restriction endonuclease subunit S [Xanthomonas translucens]|uniref:restriction endonuclease subunit S n=1 Tax=Xanthomonas campestris pv. translucens TaxID=343 RepID=UPI0009BC977D|nr:restriction endonuclease subunit S [Xanthomonas translucens]